MKNQKVILTSIALSALLLGGAATLPSAFASENSGTDRMNSLIEKIATKFNLNQDEVKQVFEEERTARHEEMKTKMETKFQERLSAAVSSGNLTQEKADLITTKKNEVMTQMETIRAIENETERKAAIDALRDDVRTWAADNDVSPKYLMFGKKGHDGGRGGEMGGMRHMES